MVVGYPQDGIALRTDEFRRHVGRHAAQLPALKVCLGQHSPSTHRDDIEHRLIIEIGFIVARYRFRILTSIASRWLRWRRFSPGVGERVLIAGLGEEFNIAAWLLRQDEFRYVFSIVGVVDDCAFTHMGMRMNDCLVLGRTADIPDLVNKFDIGVIIFTNIEVAPDIKDHITDLCQAGNLRIAFVNQMINILSQQITRPVDIPEHLLWSQDHLKYFALYDAPTGLPNRFLFQQQLQRSVSYSQRYLTLSAVLFIHLEGLSVYCEQSGEKTRISILKQVTNRFSSINGKAIHWPIWITTNLACFWNMCQMKVSYISWQKGCGNYLQTHSM